MRKRLLTLSAVMFAALLCSAPGARAAVIACGDSLDIAGAAGPQFGSVTWGGTYDFCASPKVFSDAYGFEVVVSSAQTVPPPPSQFAGYIQIDYSDFAPGDFSNHSFVIPLLSLAPGAAFSLTDGVGGTAPGSLTTTDTGGGVFKVEWAGSGVDLQQQRVIRISWEGSEQVPEPLTLTLLGTGGVALLYRRRRQLR